MQLKPNIKIWLSTPDAHSVFGSGKYHLLCAIEELGSLAAAAEKLNISYRKAWGLLKEAEQQLGIALVIKTRGGANGGRTSLTPEGGKLAAAYSAFVAEVKKSMELAYQKTMRNVVEETT